MKISIRSLFAALMSSKPSIKKDRLSLEMLESREVPAAFIWNYTGGGVGDSSVAANWLGAPAVPPTAADDIIIPLGVNDINLKLDAVNSLTVVTGWTGTIYDTTSLSIADNASFPSCTMVLGGSLNLLGSDTNGFADNNAVSFGKQADAIRGMQTFTLLTPDHTAGVINVNASVTATVNSMTTDDSIQNQGKTILAGNLTMNDTGAKISNYGTLNLQYGNYTFNTDRPFWVMPTLDNYGTAEVFVTPNNSPFTMDTGIKNIGGTFTVDANATLNITTGSEYGTKPAGGGTVPAYWAIVNLSTLSLGTGATIQMDNSAILCEGGTLAVQTGNMPSVSTLTGGYLVVDGGTVSFGSGAQASLTLDKTGSGTVKFQNNSNLNFTADLTAGVADRINCQIFQIDGTGTATVNLINVPAVIPNNQVVYINAVLNAGTVKDFANYVLAPTMTHAISTGLNQYYLIPAPVNNPFNPFVPPVVPPVTPTSTPADPTAPYVTAPVSPVTTSPPVDPVANNNSVSPTSPDMPLVVPVVDPMADYTVPSSISTDYVDQFEPICVY